MSAAQTTDVVSTALRNPPVIHRRKKVVGQGTSVTSRPDSEHFTYDELSTDQDHIRVLVVEPGDDSETLRCTLRQVPLSHKHVCLSYTWGDEPAIGLIHINGKMFHVRPNLLMFLRMMRRWQDTSELWVDAICINQQNALEQSNQVRKMAEIYQSAETVYMWIDCDTTRFEMAMRELGGATWRQNPSRSMSMTGLSGERPRHDSDLGDDTKHFVVSQLYRALHHLTSDRYFERLWVVQEVQLAQHVVLMWGNVRVPWLEVCAQIRAMRDELLEARQDSRTVDARSSSGMVDIPFEAAQLAMVDVPRYRCKGAGLLELLRSSETKQCSEPRDRIYAILGLAEFGEDFAVDYTESLPALSLRVLDFVLMTTRTASSYVLLSEILQRLGISMDSVANFTSPCWREAPVLRQKFKVSSLPFLSCETLQRGPLRNTDLVIWAPCGNFYPNLTRANDFDPSTICGPCKEALAPVIDWRLASACVHSFQRADSGIPEVYFREGRLSIPPYQQSSRAQNIRIIAARVSSNGTAKVFCTTNNSEKVYDPYVDLQLVVTVQEPDGMVISIAHLATCTASTCFIRDIQSFFWTA